MNNLKLNVIYSSLLFFVCIIFYWTIKFCLYASLFKEWIDTKWKKCINWMKKCTAFVVCCLDLLRIYSLVMRKLDTEDAILEDYMYMYLDTDDDSDTRSQLLVCGVRRLSKCLLGGSWTLPWCWMSLTQSPSNVQNNALIKLQINNHMPTSMEVPPPSPIPFRPTQTSFFMYWMQLICNYIGNQLL